MSMALTVKLLQQFPIISDQITRDELGVILDELQTSLVTPGGIVEFGCYVGTTSLFIRRVLNEYKDQRPFHVYDSFEGLPAKTPKDSSPVGEQFKAGELIAAKKQLLLNFKKAGLRPPEIHKGWFSEVRSELLPSPISFAFLDGDFYESIRDSFAAITPHLDPHAIIVVDDYVNEALPGAAVAANEWATQHGYTIKPIFSLGIIHMSEYAIGTRTRR